MNELKIKEEIPLSIINNYIQYLAVQISKLHIYEEMPIQLISILKGAAFFTVDLQRALYWNKISTQIQYIHASSYEGHEVSKLEFDISMIKDLDNTRVILLDTICDTGKTINGIYRAILNKYINIKSLRTCVLFNKSELLEGPLRLNHVGKDLNKDKFYVGYGLDYKEELRDLPGLYSIIP